MLKEWAFICFSGWIFSLLRRDKSEPATPAVMCKAVVHVTAPPLTLERAPRLHGPLGEPFIGEDEWMEGPLGGPFIGECAYRGKKRTMHNPNF